MKHNFGTVVLVEDGAEHRESLVRQLGPTPGVVNARSSKDAEKIVSDRGFDALISGAPISGVGPVALVGHAAHVQLDQVPVLLRGLHNPHTDEAATGPAAYLLDDPSGSEFEQLLREALGGHQRDVDRIGDELSAYLDLVQPGDCEAVSDEVVLDQLRGALSELPWVEGLNVRTCKRRDERIAPSGGGNAHAASLGSGAPRQEQTVIMEGPEGSLYQVWVAWRSEGRYAHRLIDLCLRRASDTLKMRRLADVLTRRTNELRFARGELRDSSQRPLGNPWSASAAHGLRLPISIIEANQVYVERNPHGADIAAAIHANRAAIQMIGSIVDALCAAPADGLSRPD